MPKTHRYAVRAVMLGSLIAASGLSAVQAQGRYWKDSQGGWVRDSAGNCVRSGQWQGGEYTDGCDPEKVEVSKFEAPLPPPTQIPEAIALEVDTLFQFDSAELTSEGRQAVDEVATQLKDVERIERVAIDGYTDSTGPEEYNLRLSERRADVIRDELVRMGVNPTMMQIRGHGEADPVASNDTPQGRKQNRRAVLSITAERSATP
jgi:OOP family OmpA-OmpF porin